MVGSVSAGKIVYEVDMDTRRLLDARREVDAALNGLNGSMGRLEASVTRTERSIGSMERTMSSLSGVAKGLLAALSVQQVASYADAWTELNNKVSNSIRTGETQAEVMQRIFDISQATQSTLNGTATLYARLERGTRTYNTSAEDLARLTTIINQGFAVSGATAQEAENAIIQLSQGIASGVLRGEEFNSVSEQGSRLMIALADSMGVSIGQLRSMAAEGKLTTDVVVNGLLSQGDAIGKEFANTTVSIAKGLQVAGNNVTKFFGENSTVKSFAAGFRDSVITISENLEVLGGALIGVAAIMGGRFVGAMAMATTAQASRIKETIQGIAATRLQAKEELAASVALQRRIQLDKQAALATLKRAEEQYVLARGSAAEALAYQNLIRLRSIYIGLAAEEVAANNAVAASQARVAATGITMANAWKAVTVATAPLGGPLGVIAIVAAGWYLYSQRQAEARKEAIAFADTIPEVIKRLNDMNLAQAQGVRADTVSSIKAQEEGIAKLESSIDELNSKYKKRIDLAAQMGGGDEKNNGHIRIANELANELAKKYRDLDGDTARLRQTKEALHLMNIQVNKGIVEQMKAARDNALATAEAEKQASFLGGTQAFLAMKLGQTTEKFKEFNSEALKIDWGGKEGEKLIKQAERRLALAKLEGEARARLQATFDAEDAGTTDPLAIARLQDTYAATDRVTQAKKEQTKEDKSATAEAKKAESQAERNAKVLDEYSQKAKLSAESTAELSRENTILAARQKLTNPTPKQIAQIERDAAATWDTASAIKAQAAAEKLLPEARENASYKQDIADLNTALAAKKISQEQYNETAERLEAMHHANLAKIRAQQAVTPQQEAAGTVDPVQQLANENARKMALMQQYQQQEQAILKQGYLQGKLTYDQYIAAKMATDNQYLELRAAQEAQYEQQRIAAQWEIYRNQSTANELLAVSIESMQTGATNAITGLLNGTQSLSEAFANLGTSVINGVVSSLVQMGTQWVMSAMMGQAAQTGAIAANQAAATAALAASTLAGTAAATTLLASWSPAAMVASIATSGGAATAGMAGYTAAMAGSKVMAVAGAREHGGPVSASSMYRVGEGGKPEIFKASNGSQYMIPGDNGRVISNRDIGGGGSGQVIHQTIQVNGNPDDRTLQLIQQAAKDGAKRGYQMVVGDLAQGTGQASKALKHTFTTTNRIG